MNRFYGYTRFCVEGLNLHKIPQLFAREGIPLFRLKRSKNGRVCFCVHGSNRGKAVALLTAKCYNIAEQEDYGAVLFCLRHRFLAVCLLAVLLVVCSASGFVWKTEIEGQNSEEALAVLRQGGVSVGTRKSVIRLDEVETLLCTRVRGVAVARAELRGCVLYVRLFAAETKPPETEDHVRKDVLSPADGVVESIYASAGTLLVQAGDEVKKGQILIAGYHTFPDGTQRDERAMGGVTLAVRAEATVLFEPQKTVAERTGKVWKATGFRLFGHEVPPIGKNPFKTYETEETEHTLCTLPLIFRFCTVYETSLKRVECSYEEELPHLQEQALALAKQKATFGIERTEYETSRGNSVTAIVWGKETFVFEREEKE